MTTPRGDKPHDHATDGAPLQISGMQLSIWEVEDVAHRHRPVELTPEALQRVESSRSSLQRALANGEAIYGVNTGFGSLARQRLAPEQLTAVQHNLIRSHAAGLGDPLDPTIVRAMLLLLAASLSRGHSGVRVELPGLIVGMLNAGITPVVPETGSVGASGDLAPLAHAALTMLGEGAVTDAHGNRRDAAGALTDAGLTPVALGPKEGLALVNGTHLMAARAALTLCAARRVVDAALIAAAMSVDAARATDRVFDDRIHTARNQPPQRRVATRLRDALAGSEIQHAHRENDPRVQDPYSFRCTPQVVGAAIDTIDRAAETVERELGAVTDNPLVFDPASDEHAPAVLSGGNFHGLPLALALDTVAIAMAHIAGIAERRVFYLLAASDPENPINPHLSRNPGVQSGLMMTQYAAAACCNELIGLANPASVANLSTCAGMEDYNSFGPRSAAKAHRAVRLTERVIATELVVAAEAIEYQRPLRSAPPVERAHATVRETVPPFETDRPPGPEIERVAMLIRAGRFA